MIVLRPHGVSFDSPLLWYKLSAEPGLFLFLVLMPFLPNEFRQMGRKKIFQLFEVFEIETLSRVDMFHLSAPHRGRVLTFRWFSPASKNKGMGLLAKCVHGITRFRTDLALRYLICSTVLAFVAFYRIPRSHMRHRCVTTGSQKNFF